MAIVSCNSANNDIVTERIQYDVRIKSPDSDMNWWEQNIEGIKRERLVKKIMEDAYAGKIQAYNYLNQPISAEDVKNIGKRDDTLFMQSLQPPYEDSVTIIHERLKINDITKIRFLEEWCIDEKTLKIDKKVLGFAPMVEDYDDYGNKRGYKLLFWVYFDKRYPLKD